MAQAQAQAQSAEIEDAGDEILATSKDEASKQVKKPAKDAKTKSDEDFYDDDAFLDGDDDDAFSPIEELAAEMGWDPNYDGPEALDAKTWIVRGGEMQSTMRKHLRDQKAQMRRMLKSVENLKKHHLKVQNAQKKQYEAEIRRLKAQRVEAIEEGDVGKVEELDEQIGTISSAIEDPVEDEDGDATDLAAQYNPAFVDWLEVNTWYDRDKEMTKYADTVAKRYEGAPLERVLRKVDEAVRDIFPDKFSDKRARRKKKSARTAREAPEVESATKRPAKRKRKITRRDLDPEHRRIVDDFVSQGIMTEEEYIEELVRIGEVG